MVIYFCWCPSWNKREFCLYFQRFQFHCSIEFRVDLVFCLKFSRTDIKDASSFEPCALKCFLECRRHYKAFPHINSKFVNLKIDFNYFEITLGVFFHWDQSSKFLYTILLVLLLILLLKLTCCWFKFYLYSVTFYLFYQSSFQTSKILFCSPSFSTKISLHLLSKKFIKLFCKTFSIILDRDDK